MTSHEEDDTGRRESPGERSRLRIVDASLNRCAEALRVVEDICRFHWDLAGASRELKELRHAVLAAFVPDPASRVESVRHRDIEEDVGRAFASPSTGRDGSETPSDSDRDLLRAAVRNLERAKEALRTLEEIERAAPRVGAGHRRVEALRYHLYSIEKGLLARVERRGGRLDACRLCLLVTTELLGGPLAEIVAGAIEGGVDLVQMREKDLPDRPRLELARRLRELTAAAGVPLIVNDRPDLAMLVEADGVHVGQDDLPAGAVRRLVGERMLLGVSTHSPDEARKAVRESADYIGIGPIFPTTTKQVGPCIGPEGYHEIAGLVDVPAFAIGGIGPSNAGALARAGAARAAVSAAIVRCRTGVEARDAARCIADALKGSEAT